MCILLPIIQLLEYEHYELFSFGKATEKRKSDTDHKGEEWETKKAKKYCGKKRKFT